MNENIILLGIFIGILFIPLLTIVEGIIIFLEWRGNEHSVKRMLAWFVLISLIVLIVLLLIAVILFFIEGINKFLNTFFPSFLVLLLFYLLFLYEGLLIFIAWYRNERKIKRIIAWSGLLLPLPLTISYFYSIVGAMVLIPDNFFWLPWM